MRAPTAGKRPIVARLVGTVAVAMTVVLALGAAFVYWRVSHALSVQLDRDLDAYREVAESTIEHGGTLVSDTPGLRYQLYDLEGHVTGGDADRRLATIETVRRAAATGALRGEGGGSLLPPSAHPYRYIVAPVTTPSGRAVAAYEISRRDHDEALRELLVQLSVVGLATLLAASLVGYRTARAALDPVERYRRAAAGAGAGTRLPVGEREDELSRLGHTFNDLLDRIAAASERERQFLADASHELRGPLTVMRAEVDLARLRPGDAEATAESLRSLSTQVGRLVTLCNALLDLEELRAQPERVRGPLPELELEDVLEAVAARWRHPAAAAGREIVLDVPAGLRVRGHEHWLDLAVDNLVSNALRYGAGPVRVSAADDPVEPDRVVIAVSDDGPGFAPDFAERAFDRFARADESRAGDGTGLGLALVWAVAETHGGTADISGSRVAIRLPRAG